MSYDPKACEGCAAGCRARHTDEQTEEEINAAPYLIFAAVIIVVLALVFRWIL